MAAMLSRLGGRGYQVGEDHAVYGDGGDDFDPDPDSDFDLEREQGNLGTPILISLRQGTLVALLILRRASQPVRSERYYREIRLFCQ